jgi:hypothetical protein
VVLVGNLFNVGAELKRVLPSNSFVSCEMWSLCLFSHYIHMYCRKCALFRHCLSHCWATIYIKESVTVGSRHELQLNTRMSVLSRVNERPGTTAIPLTMFPLSMFPLMTFPLMIKQKKFSSAKKLDRFNEI